MVSTLLVRTIYLLKLSLRIRLLYINWLAVLLCLMKQSHVWSTFQNNIYGTVLLSLGLFWSADNYLSNFRLYRTPRNDRSWERMCWYVVWDLPPPFKTLWRNPWFWLLFQFVSTPSPKGCALNVDYQYYARYIILIDILLVVNTSRSTQSIQNFENVSESFPGQFPVGDKYL